MWLISQDQGDYDDEAEEEVDAVEVAVGDLAWWWTDHY